MPWPFNDLGTNSQTSAGQSVKSQVIVSRVVITDQMSSKIKSQSHFPKGANKDDYERILKLTVLL